MSRDRLVKLLGMLGSDFDGERANAARMIAKMAKEANKSVADLVMGGGAPQIIYRDRVETVYRDRPCPVCEATKDNFDFGNLRRPKSNWKPKGEASLLAGLRDALDYPEQLTAWEWEFIEDVLRKFTFDYELSDKQAKAARKIIAKVNSEPLL